MAQRVLSICCHRVVITELSILVVILPGVLLVRRDTISKFVLWTLTPETVMPLEML